MPSRPVPQLAVGAVVAAYATAVIVAPASGSPATSYAATSPTARAIDIAAGLALMCAGVFLFADPRRRTIGALAVAAGALWFGPDWEGWDHGPELVRSVAALTPPAFLAAVLHLGLALPRGGLRSRFDRLAVVNAYVLATAAIVTRALLRDPLLDLYCWRNCLANSFLAGSTVRLTHTVGVLWNSVLLALSLMLLLVAGSRAFRRPAAGGAAAAALVGAVWVSYAGVLLYRPLEDPRRVLYVGLFHALAAGTLALAAAAVWQATLSLRARASLARLAEELRTAPRPGNLERRLAEALGDPLLRIGYLLRSEGRYVDSHGLPFEVKDRARTPIVRRGETMAVVAHDPGLLDVPDLGREIGAAARLAVENERLRAQALAQLEALRASRARIVADGDRARRGLERALHDGAQQRLLAVSYRVRLARSHAEAAGEAEVAAFLADAQAEAAQALHDLRTLAHGIFPAVLGDAGLSAALATLADTAPVAIDLEAVTTERFAEKVEAAAYAVAAETVGDAAARGATFVRLAMTQTDGVLLISSSDDGAPSAPLLHVSDRIGALGGSLDFGPGGMRAEIPCA